MSGEDHALTRLMAILGRLGRLNEDFVSEVCGRHGIQPSEFRVLSLLHETGPDGVRPATIGRWVLQTAGGLAATLRRLEADDRIERTDDPDDGRGKLISLTPSGEELHDVIGGDLAERYRFALDHVDLDRALDQVIQLTAAFEQFGNHPQSSSWGSAPVPLS